MPTLGDKEGRTGSVAHVVKLSGVQDGKDVIINIVAVVQIGWDKEQERRQVEMESFVLAFE